MDRWMVLLGALALSALLVGRAGAASCEEIYTRQEEGLGLEALEREARRGGGTVEYGTGLDDGLGQLAQQGGEAARGIVRGAVRSGVVLLAVLLLCSVGDTVYAQEGASRLRAVTLAGTLAITALAAADTRSMMGVGTQAISHMASFANVLLPTVAAVTVTTGAVAGAAARQMAAVLFCNLLVNLIHRVLIPLVYGYIALCVVQTALDNEGVGRLAEMLKGMVTALLTAVMTGFVGYLTLNSVVAGAADAAAVKAAKFAISGAVPVVGKILSDAAESILASAGVLRGTVGVFGALTVLSICLAPLLQTGGSYLAYKGAAALGAVVGSGPLHKLAERLGGAFGMILGMTGCCCLLLLIALVSSLTATAA